MTKLWTCALVLAMGFPSAATGAPPHCAGAVEIAHATITRVERNGALILGDGRAAHLEGIRLPQGAIDRAPQFIADEATHVLSELTVGHVLVLTAVPPKEDRYDRIRAQAFDGDEWIQLEMLKRGLARVSIAADRVECAGELYAAESTARQSRAGLWSSSAYAVRPATSVGADIGTFQLVEGKVVDAEVRDGRAWLVFGNGLKGDFSALIAPEDLRAYRAMGVNPHGYEGKIVRVRGIVQNLSGPAIAVANPAQVQVVAVP